MERIRAEGLFKVFGQRGIQQAVEMARAGESKEAIKQKTQCVLAINNVDFTVNRSEIFVIVGLSGCGKSTLLRCLNRLIDPTAGQVLVEGQDITRLSLPDLRQIRKRKMAMVFQRFGLLPHRNVVSNVAFGLEVQEVPLQVRTDKAMEMLELVGLAGYAESGIDQLSGGMQQRVGLARALAIDPDIMLMDEAFSALDPIRRSQLQNELLDIQAKMHKSIVFITHDLDEGLKLGDRVAIMKEGRIVQVGTPEEILMSPSDSYVTSFMENVDRAKIITAQTVMERPEAITHPRDGLRVAFYKMQKENLGSLFVVDKERRYNGIISKQRAQLGSEQNGSLMDYVTLEVPACSPSDPLVGLMKSASESSLPIPVVTDDRKLVGAISREHILSGMSKN